MHALFHILNKGILFFCVGFSTLCLGQDEFALDTAKVNRWNQLADELAPTNQNLAEAYADSAIHVSKKIGYQIGYGDGVNNLGLANDYAGNFEKALTLYKSAVSIYKESNYSKGRGRALNNIGIVHNYTGNYDEAVEYFLECIPYFKESGYDKGVASSLNNLGLIARKKGDYIKALDYYEESIAYKKAMGDKKGEMLTVTNISAIYVYLRDWKNALKFNEMAVSLAGSIEDEQSIAEGYLQRALILNGQDRNIEAIKYYHKASQKLIEINSYKSLVVSYAGLGALYMEEEQLDSAQFYLENSLVLLSSHDDASYKLEVLKSLSKVWHEKKNFKKSLDYLQQYIALSDTIQKSSQSEDVKELESKYNYLSQKDKISDLRKEKEIDELNQKYLIFAFIAILVVLIYFFYLARKLKHQKDAVADALGDKELLLKEIHHRVKNNLQMVSSLLYLQSEYIHDDEALKAITVSRTRVEAMAIIHQKLYKDDNVIGITTTDYVDDLVDGIFETLEIDENHIRVVKIIDSLTLDIDTTIPIGLILNELITNSIKHAFPKEQENKTVNIELKKSGELLFLKVQDNGTGNELVNTKHSSGFGQKLIDMLAKQLRADVKIDNSNGYSVEMTIKKFKLQ